VSLTRIVLGWLAVSAWFALVDLLLGRLRGADASPRGTPPRWLPLLEGLLFTLFAALWFGSLGSGEWVLLFLMLALFIQLPHRLRDAVQRSRPAGLAMAVAAGVFRLLVAGGILALVT
jgi:hypothetical protein